MAWLKNIITAIILRMVRLWIKAMLRTITTEITIAVIQIMTILGTVTVVIVTRVIRPMGI